MKIAMDSRSATIHSGTGIGTYTQNLVDVLIKKDNLDIKFFWTGDYGNFSSNELNKLCFVSSRNNNFFEKTFIPHYICNNKIDLYHIPQNGIGLYDNPDINTIVTIHDLIPYIMPETVGSGYLQKFLRDIPTIINSSKGIITVSNHSKKDILKFFPSCPSSKIIVTPLFANSSFKPLPKNYCSIILKQKHNIDFPFILYLGGFSTRKNVKMLINSFKSILNDIPSNYKLVLIGSIKDEGNKLIDYVHSNGLADKILFLGYIDYDQLPLFYNCCECFVYPSLYEGFGLPPLEAMSCRCPVITSNVSSIPEVTSSSAMLIDPLNEEALSNSLIKMINTPDLKEDYGLLGYNQSKNFSLEKTASCTINAYTTFYNAIKKE